ncbi:MAG TPA: DNA methyltransferase [Candidatus Saccharimonadales bacterium]|nr:DNA methyltransferase [Candidatus Saccharimonadales bacterium]
MTAAEFKQKWSRYQGKETSAYQGHFDDLCRLLGQPTPAEADPSGGSFFCFQKRVVKDAELFNLDETPDAGEPAERGFADVWKKGCFAWEYKGKKKNLDEAYKQLLRYRESLLNPPLLVVCDFDRYIIKTNFNGTVQEVYEFTNEQIDRPENIRVLRALFEEPNFLKPQQTTAAVTEALAKKIAEVARSLQKRESTELTDAQSRAEVNFAQRKNLRIARFLNRIVFCLFAEDTRLLPDNLFTEILKAASEDTVHFAKTLEELFNVMATGGNFGQHKIRHFNGHLFDDSTVFELNETELRILGEAAEADWQFIQPSIMGTLFERALEPEQRSQLGAHYTSEADIKTLVEPVLMQPFRRDWTKIKAGLAAGYVKGKGNAAQRGRLAQFQKQLAAVTVLDPACGSGNFLYVSLQLLLALEKEVIAFAAQLGFKFGPQVTVRQLMAIEINPYAFELAQVSVQIGYLQWRRDNGFDNDRSPILQNLDGFQNEDALLVPHFRNKAKTLKEARAREHKGEDALKFYTEREWPKCAVIVSNPPFLGGKLIRRELGTAYVDALFENFGGRVPPEADLCCYWFEKARQQIDRDGCLRAGLLATQGIRGGANRAVLKRIKETGDIFFAESDRAWILAGANVHVSMVGFDNGTEKDRLLNGRSPSLIHANLSGTIADTTTAQLLQANFDIAFMGDTKGGAFDITEKQALEMLRQPNPHRRPNSDVIVPWVNGLDVARRPRHMFILDFGLTRTEEDCAKYQAPFAYVREHIRPQRVANNRALYAKYWWRHVEPRPGMLAALLGLSRFITTIAVAKYRLFVWMESPTLPDHSLFAFVRNDDYYFGLLQSRVHEVWALKQGTRLETRPRYTPTTCFETFPFPFLDDLKPAEPPAVEPAPRLKRPASELNQMWAAASNYYMMGEKPTPYGSPDKTPNKYRSVIADSAKELNELRERWLNPPEWTVEKIFEFPGSINGPWARYVVKPDKNGIGMVRYPRLQPRNADCAAKLKERTLTKLYNERPAWLDFVHQKLNAAVAAAYGWPLTSPTSKSWNGCWPSTSKGRQKKHALAKLQGQQRNVTNPNRRCFNYLRASLACWMLRWLRLCSNRPGDSAFEASVVTTVMERLSWLQTERQK